MIIQNICAMVYGNGGEILTIFYKLCHVVFLQQDLKLLCNRMLEIPALAQVLDGEIPPALSHKAQKKLTSKGQSLIQKIFLKQKSHDHYRHIIIIIVVFLYYVIAQYINIGQ